RSRRGDRFRVAHARGARSARDRTPRSWPDGSARTTRPGSRSAPEEFAARAALDALVPSATDPARAALEGAPPGRDLGAGVASAGRVDSGRGGALYRGHGPRGGHAEPGDASRPRAG